MATRTDVDIEYFTSPRVLEVRAPSTEMIMQDLVDTARKLEDSFQGMGFKKLINASGKEDLGGGVKVGITVAMQDMLLAAAARTTPAETGTVTGSPASPVTGHQIIQDTASLFITNKVKRGSLVVNFTDHSIADVVSVDSETQLTTKTLVNGLTNTYTVGDVYHVFNITQINFTGGNLVAVDANQVTIPAILPTAFTQITLTSSASATLQEQKDIQFASFNGGVTLDVIKGVSSDLTHPAGTPRQPVKTLDDAITIANINGFDTIFVKGTYVFAVSDVLDGFILQGLSSSKTTLVLTAAATITNCIFRQCTLTGNLDGGNDASFCVIAGLNFFDGTLLDCLLTSAPVILNGTQANLLRCASSVAGGSASQTAILDFNNQPVDMINRDFQGGITLKNCTQAVSDVSMDMSSGQVIIDNSNTAGNITVRGVGKLIDNSAGTIVTNELVDGAQLQIMSKIMRNRMETNPTTGIMTVYDDDNTTVLLTGNIYEDVLAAQIYRGRGMERRNRLT